MFGKFIHLIKRCLALALPYGRGKLVMIVSVILANGLLQVIGVTSIFPFFALATDPGAFRNSKIGGQVLSMLPPVDDRQLLIGSGLMAIFLLITSNFMTLLSEVLRAKYSHGFGHWLRSRMAEDIASRPYGYFLTQNSSRLMQKVLSDVMYFIGNVFLPLTEALSRAITLGLLIVTIFLVQPIIALTAGVGLGAMYGVIFLMIRPKSQKIGEGLKLHHREQGIAAQHLMSGIKPVLVHNRTEHFISQIRYHSSALAGLHAKLPIYNNGPRYIVEPLAFGGMIGVVLLMILRGQPFAEVVPTLAVLALAGYRILPTVQLLYGQLSTVTAWSYTLGELEAELHSLEKNGDAPKIIPSGPIRPLPFSRTIALKGVSFKYPVSEHPVINNISLDIHKNESVGIVGTTGSGKSTLVDLILGLHSPSSGKIVIDDTELTKDLLPAWRSKIGYVPQEIYLLDESIGANIAFGIPKSEINKDLLKKAAEAAQILDFINTLPKGFDSLVGERGARLSGGQRQRIGLARALYHQPEILILDEATSALDNETEAAVMETIRSLHGNMTLIIIAHRLTTLRGCDKVISLQKGSVNTEPLISAPEEGTI